MHEGIVTRRNVVAEVGSSAFTRLVGSGVLRPAFRGIYLLRAVPRSDDAVRRRAALVYADRSPAADRLPAYLCCQSAATEWALPLPLPKEVSVGVPRGRTVARQAGLVVHGHDLPADAIVTRRDVRLVTIHQALVQAFGTLDRDDRRQLVIRSVQDRLVAPERIRASMRRTTPGRAELRELLTLTESGSHSELEITALATVLDRYGLSTVFVQQFSRATSQRSIPMDFAAVEHRLNLETDGSRYHTDPPQRRADVRRDLDLSRQGWVVIRCQYENVTDEPERVAAALLVALQQRGWTAKPTTTAGRLLLATLAE